MSVGVSARNVVATASTANAGIAATASVGSVVVQIPQRQCNRRIGSMPMTSTDGDGSLLGGAS